MRKREKLGFSISFKITFSFFVLIAVFLIVSVLLFQRAMLRAVSEEKEARIQATATLLAVILTPSVEQEDYDSVTKNLEDVISFPEVRYAFLVDNDGDITANASRARLSESFYMQVSKLSTTKEANVAGLNATSDPFSITKVKAPPADMDTNVESEVFDYSLPLAGGKLHVGQAVGLDLTSVAAIMGSAIRSIAMLVPVLLAFSLWLLRRFLRPLGTLVKSAKAISLGDLNTRLTWDRGREVKELALAFERMRISLKLALGRRR